ncbi:unnamed protein product [Vitrella brassicaformis CCMP3155]|uniref:Uncharacterized protein n=1 Tax=Vitrella brassicaformis (strain CCMP3155) TaxID=1169540 RepID=A0A0G4EH62_VITBC|nr:unnamed protein product [Vitrella brassicaformis CCMP3155]|eukprot:CEL95193.1 unnamed protein product [Vitrella brassicaformis CCMP3155]
MACVDGVEASGKIATEEKSCGLIEQGAFAASNATYMAGLHLVERQIQLAKQLTQSGVDLSQSAATLSSTAHDSVTGTAGLIDALVSRQTGSFLQAGDHFNQPRRPKPDWYKRPSGSEMVEFFEQHFPSSLTPANGVCIRETEKRGSRPTLCYLTCPNKDFSIDWGHPMLGRIHTGTPKKIECLTTGVTGPAQKVCQPGSKSSSRLDFCALNSIGLNMENLREYDGQWGHFFHVKRGQRSEGQNKCEGIALEFYWRDSYSAYKVPVPDLGADSRC